MAERRTRIVKPDILRDLMARMLRAAGCEAQAAATAADVFLEADLRGIGLQGLDHLPHHDSLAAIRQDERQGTAADRPRRRRVGLIDGGAGPGQVAAILAADLAAAKAAKTGVATVGIFNSSDIFMVGFYSERMARAGRVGFVFSDGPPLVHAHGGVERALGTNPLSIAMPTGGGHPLVLDLSTSGRSASRVRQAAYHDESVPEGIGVDKHGRPTRRAAEIREGAISPLAGHKGFGLSLCVALLSGPLVGAEVGKALAGQPGGSEGGVGKGHLFLAVDPACFGDPSAFRRSVGAYIAEVKNSRRAAGVAAIRIPGDRAFAARERSMREGVEIYEVVWQNTLKLAAELGVPMPAVTV